MNKEMLEKNNNEKQTIDNSLSDIQLCDDLEERFKKIFGDMETESQETEKREALDIEELIKRIDAKIAELDEMEAKVAEFKGNENKS